ncbi:hypothetical protein OG244_26410 [Streptomyces brevispora]|uniref:hypothetical protein n=1 Tax=Streptomyces brevispora TaxID=887462 RepID=UPI002E2FD2B1|nr:hypothetical protein [Streptomyces brevispora]
MTYVFKGAGMGLTKISDVMAGFKGLDNIEVPTLPEGAITLPDGAFKFADGTLYLPEGAAVPEGAFEVPGNSVRLPDGAEIPAGAIDLGDGVVRLPEGMAPPADSIRIPADSIRIPEGALKLPEGTTIAPENALKGLDRDGNTVYLDGPGNVLKEDGTLLQHHTAARKESPVSDADSPAAHTSSPQPVLVGAHTVGGNTDNLIRTGDDLGDFGRVGDDATGTGTGTDRTPGGSANNLPGGSAGHHMPSGSLDGGGRGSSSADTTSVGGGRGDISNGSTGDSGFTSGHHHPETPGMAGSGAAARASANATPSTGGQAGDGTGVGQSADNAAQLVERTPEEAKRIQDEHVRLVNEDPIWRDEHYTAHLHRKNANEIVDGQYLPVLKDVGNGRYVSTSSLPYGPSEKYRLRIENPQLSNIPTDHATKLDGLAEKHLAYKELGVADRAHTKNPTAETAEALQTAKDAFGDTPVNTKVGEALGEASARLHVIQEVFPGAREVTDLPSTANGSRSFDQLYELGNGEFLVVEAKAPSGRLDWRQGAGIDANIQVKQGTLQYLRTIATEMYSRGGRDRELAEQLRIALLDEKIQYVMVQAKHHSGSYAGGELHYFKIFEGETQ